MDCESMDPGFESRESHDFFYVFFFFHYYYSASLQIQHMITVSTQLSYFITPYGAQASSAFSALITTVVADFTGNTSVL